MVTQLCDFEPVSLCHQLQILAEHYPELDACRAEELIGQLEAPPMGQMFQLLPVRSSVDVGPAQTVQARALRELLSSRDTVCYWREEVDRLSPNEAVSSVLDALEANVSGDFHVVRLCIALAPAKFRTEVENAGIYGLAFPSWVVLNHLLTHPDRLADSESRNIVAAGDLYLSEDGMQECSMLLEFAYCSRGDRLYVDRVPIRVKHNPGIEEVASGRFRRAQISQSWGPPRQLSERELVQYAGDCMNSTGWIWKDYGRNEDGLMMIYP